eukprot:Phypoly_transcript_12712.p1 GENE.Phypoly_transcript_12712~~Phypoly_transcript_12712.p1  ORF type:complete len:348 (+),score=54.16 Phypoly_transcript_12712:59-1045(+)
MEDFDECHNILLAGCGGGYDFLNAVPLYFALRHRSEKLGKNTNLFIANQTFSTLSDLDNIKKFGPCCVEVTPDTVRKQTGKVPWKIEKENYFPELFLSKWFKDTQGLDVPIYTFDRAGVANLSASYDALIDAFKIDCIILVDGGTDSLMRGDEKELGTPTEDMSSIAAVAQIHKIEKKYLVCIGMGIDTFHGVNHALYLENVASLAREGAFLGSFSLLNSFEEAKKFESAYTACQPENSIVCSSVLSAVKGEFGNYHSLYTKNRTAASKLFISPLMALFWCFHLEPLARRVVYLDKIKNTQTMAETSKIIHTTHAAIKDKRVGAHIPY